MNLKTKSFIKARLKFFVIWISIIIVSAGVLTMIMYVIGQGVEEERDVEVEEGYVSESERLKQEYLASFGDYPPFVGYVKSASLGDRSIVIENLDNYIETYSWDEDTECLISGLEPNCEDAESCEYFEDPCDLMNIDEFRSEFSVTVVPAAGKYIKSINFSNGLYGM